MGPSSVLIPPAPPDTLIPKIPNLSSLGLVKIRDSDREMVPSAMGRPGFEFDIGSFSLSFVVPPLVERQGLG
jgi:hypothetical protein